MTDCTGATLDRVEETHWTSYRDPAETSLRWTLGCSALWNTGRVTGVMAGVWAACVSAATGAMGAVTLDVGAGALAAFLPPAAWDGAAPTRAQGSGCGVSSPRA